jgi:ABC-type uncharacterized transport system substrate-binding protein
MNKSKILLLGALFMLLSLGSLAAQSVKGKKIVYVDSYHEGYAWSDGITKAIQFSLAGKGVELTIYRMDTKRNPSEDFKKQSALKAKELIDSSRPDAVILSDDNSVKYILVPYFKNSSIPFIHCAVNWDDSVYGLPFKNTTGMLEVSSYTSTLTQLKDYAKGSRVGFLSANNETEKKEVEFSQKNSGISYAEVRLAGNFDDWKAAYLELQGKVDMLYCINNAGIANWNDAEASAFVLANTKIPTASHHDFMSPFVLITYAKLAGEQGTWAAQTALKILGGTPVASIPETKNKSGKVYLNMKLAAKLGITFKPALLKNAELIK